MLSLMTQKIIKKHQICTFEQREPQTKTVDFGSMLSYLQVNLISVFAKQIFSADALLVGKCDQRAQNCSGWKVLAASRMNVPVSTSWVTVLLMTTPAAATKQKIRG